jgi:hypothetical protein
MAALGSLGANGLAATLLAFASHRRIVPTQAAAQQHAVETTEKMALVAETPPEIVPPVEVATVADPAVIELAETLPRKKPIGDFVDFIAGSVELADGAMTAQSDLAGAYITWCRRRKCEPLPDEMIRQGIEMFCRAGKVERGRRGDEIYLLGVELAGGRRKRIAMAG